MFQDKDILSAIVKNSNPLTQQLRHRLGERGIAWARGGERVTYFIDYCSRRRLVVETNEGLVLDDARLVNVEEVLKEV